MKRFILLFLLPFIVLADCTEQCQREFDLAVSQLRYAQSFASSTLVDVSNLHTNYNQQIYLVQNIFNSSGIAGNPSYSSQLSQLQSMIQSESVAFSTVENDCRDTASELQAVADELGNFDCNDCCDDGGGGGSSTNSQESAGCPCSELLEQIRDEIIDYHNHFELLRNRAYQLYDRHERYIEFTTNWMGRIERRLQIPDDTLYTDLDNLFYDMQDARQDFINEIQTATSFTSGLASDLSDIPLSNEGVIGLYNMSANWADFQVNLRSAQLLENINTNLERIAFISNYLDRTQRTYFELFNNRFGNPSITTSPFINAYYTNATNFWNSINNNYTMKSQFVNIKPNV